MNDEGYKYLLKADIDKTFKKLHADKIELVESDYNKCCDIINILNKEVEKYGNALDIYKGNLKDLTTTYQMEYKTYLRGDAEKKRKYSYYRGNKPFTEKEYIAEEFRINHGESKLRFQKYIPNEKVEKKVIYVKIQNYHSRLKHSFYFCAYFNSKNRFCVDKIAINRRDKDDITFDTAKTSPNQFIILLDEFKRLHMQGEATYQQNMIKKEKIDGLKQKAGEINIKQVLNNINCDYTIQKQGHSTLVKIHLGKGWTVIKIPKKNLKAFLPDLEGIVETILKAHKLKVHFKHHQS